MQTDSNCIHQYKSIKHKTRVVYVDFYSAYTLTNLQCAHEITCKWDHKVLPASRQRWFSCLTPAYCRYSFIDPGRMKGWVWPRWLFTPRWLAYPPTDSQPVTNPIPTINRAQRRVTTLIETNMQSLSQAKTNSRVPTLSLEKNAGLSRTPVRNFPGPFRSPGMLKYKEKNTFYSQHSEYSPLQKL